MRRMSPGTALLGVGFGIIVLLGLWKLPPRSDLEMQVDWIDDAKVSDPTPEDAAAVVVAALVLCRSPALAAACNQPPPWPALAHAEAGGPGRVILEVKKWRQAALSAIPAKKPVLRQRLEQFFHWAKPDLTDLLGPIGDILDAEALLDGMRPFPHKESLQRLFRGLFRPVLHRRQFEEMDRKIQAYEEFRQRTQAWVRETHEKALRAGIHAYVACWGNRGPSAAQRQNTRTLSEPAREPSAIEKSCLGEAQAVIEASYTDSGLLSGIDRWLFAPSNERELGLTPCFLPGTCPEGLDLAELQQQVDEILSPDAGPPATTPPSP